MGLYDDEINAERDEELAQAKRTIDALVAALEEAETAHRLDCAWPHATIDAALALARKQN